MYAFGETPDAARRHLEAVEFLCEYVYRLELIRAALCSSIKRRI
nr:hypothetical protein [Alicyclobacillus sacchari]